MVVFDCMVHFLAIKNKKKNLPILSCSFNVVWKPYISNIYLFIYLFIQFHLKQGSLFRGKGLLYKRALCTYNIHDNKYNVKHMIYIDIKIENFETM